MIWAFYKSKHNFGILLDNKDSDQYKNHIIEVCNYIHLGAKGVMLCFSLADRKSFENLNRWIDELISF